MTRRWMPSRNWPMIVTGRSTSRSALAQHLFLVTVADARGLSYYGEASVAKHLSMDRATLHKARQRLLDAGLIAYERPLHQVLALEDGPPVGAGPAPPPPPAAALRRALGARS